MSGYDVCKHGRIRCAECAYVEELEDRIEELEQQNKRYREALEFYADKENYKPFDGIFLSSYQNKVDEDGGKKARQALEGEENA